MSRRDSIDVGAVGFMGTEDELLEEREQSVNSPSDWYTSSLSEKQRVQDVAQALPQSVSPRSTRKLSSSSVKANIAALAVRKTRTDSSALAGGDDRYSKGLRFRRRVTVVNNNGALMNAETRTRSEESNGPLSPTMGSRIGRYKVIRSIGQGGEGSIFLVKGRLRRHRVHLEETDLWQFIRGE